MPLYSCFLPRNMIGRVSSDSPCFCSSLVLKPATSVGRYSSRLTPVPVLTIFGLILGWLRLKTSSLYPPIILHAIFNGAALLAAVLA